MRISDWSSDVCTADRRYGKATSNAAANSGDRQPVARPAYARDRSRMGETRMWLGGAAARARSCAQCTRRLSLMPLGSESALLLSIGRSERLDSFGKSVAGDPSRPLQM